MQEEVSPCYQWLQNDSTITIRILANRCQPLNTIVDISEERVKCILLDSKNNEHRYTFNLYKKIDKSLSSFEIHELEVEIKLKKEEELFWNSLTKSDKPKNEAKNWDKIADELTKDDPKPSGDQELMQLFHDIYGKGDDDTRRAMEKSFVESKGKVLSTNWSEVGSKKVEYQPEKDN